MLLGTEGRMAVGVAVATATRLLLAGVWLYAGLSKVGDVRASVRAVKAYQAMPNALAEPVGAALPMVEITLGVLLLAGLAVRATAVVSVLLFAVFVVGIGWAWARGLRIDCGCFGGGGELGPGESPRYGVEIARDVALMLAAAVLARWPRTWFALDSVFARDVAFDEKGR
ncbi:MauE/DoxX family redox-associated membrane protein [Phytoactinopolyspora halotolerans]|uniref:DoxX family membrane protein n=1 Tax=Phytoactinopolyspora halotolerans TaxID=1981512 RepID=A0A6L9S6M7_9ACTN|nr:DoxX family membrane protein [Phytoactinopolyspora halotolerans]